jgi:hypothetical protein
MMSQRIFDCNNLCFGDESINSQGIQFAQMTLQGTSVNLLLIN